VSHSINIKIVIYCISFTTRVGWNIITRGNTEQEVWPVTLKRPRTPVIITTYCTVQPVTSTWFHVLDAPVKMKYFWLQGNWGKHAKILSLSETLSINRFSLQFNLHLHWEYNSLWFLFIYRTTLQPFHLSLFLFSWLKL